MVMDNSVYYQMVSIHPDRINITNRADIHRRSNRQIKTYDDNCDEVSAEPKRIIKYTIDDKLSPQTQTKLSRAVKYLNHISKDKKVYLPDNSKCIKFRLCFATLTLSSDQTHSDNELKNQLINQMFVELKKKYNVCNYIWRAEKQHNGNLHFHILTDVFIPHAGLRSMWNRIQNKLGYVDRYTDKMTKLTQHDYVAKYLKSDKSNLQSLKIAYKKGKSKGWSDPNSTDIHALDFIRDIDKYLIKYLAKSEQNKGISGRLWGCSQSLSNLVGGRDIVDSQLAEELSRICQYTDSYIVTGQYFTIIFMSVKYLEDLACFALLKLFNSFVDERFNTA